MPERKLPVGDPKPLEEHQLLLLPCFEEQCIHLRLLPWPARRKIEIAAAVAEVSAEIVAWELDFEQERRVKEMVLVD